jgi:hypothetical protein
MWDLPLIQRQCSRKSTCLSSVFKQPSALQKPEQQQEQLRPAAEGNLRQAPHVYPWLPQIPSEFAREVRF